MERQTEHEKNLIQVLQKKHSIDKSKAQKRVIEIKKRHPKMYEKIRSFKSSETAPGWNMD